MAKVMSVSLPRNRSPILIMDRITTHQHSQTLLHSLLYSPNNPLFSASWGSDHEIYIHPHLQEKGAVLGENVLLRDRQSLNPFK